MRLASVLSGAPFRAALLALAIFVPTLMLTGAVLHQRLATMMLRELERQVSAELVLFEEILQRGGHAALIEAVARMEQPLVAGERLTALFDADGRPLAGNLDVAPELVGWRTLTVSRRAADGGDTDYRSRVERWQRSTIVVGRSTELVDHALDSLLRYLALAGLVVTLVCLSIGFVLSRRTDTKLERMAATLDRVSRGEMQARLSVGRSNDQIDRVSRRINAHLAQLAALMSGTRHAIGSIAHDLRTPLNRASLRLQEALDEDATDERRVALVDAAAREIDALGEIVETILRINRIAASDDDRDFATIAVSPLLEEIGEVFRPVAEEAGQTLELVPSPSGATIRGDAKMLRQMLANLVENAIGHCPAGTRIRLGARVGVEGGTSLLVEDDGPGIPPEARERVLEPFFRLDPSRSSRGTGLGLALVEAVARRHRARLALEDAAPGLRLVIDFPPA